METGYWAGLMFSSLATVFSLPYFILLPPWVDVSSAFEVYLLFTMVIFVLLNSPWGLGRVVVGTLAGVCTLILFQSDGSALSSLLCAATFVGALRLFTISPGWGGVVKVLPIQLVAIMCLIFFEWVSQSMTLEIGRVFLVWCFYLCQSIIMIPGRGDCQHNPNRFNRAYRMANDLISHR